MGAVVVPFHPVARRLPQPADLPVSQNAQDLTFRESSSDCSLQTAAVGTGTPPDLNVVWKLSECCDCRIHSTTVPSLCLFAPDGSTTGEAEVKW